MKLTIHNPIFSYFVRALALVAALALLAAPLTAHAATNQVSLSANTGSVVKDKKVEVIVTVNAEDAITSAQVYVTYDASKLVFDNIVYGGALPEGGPEEGGGLGYHMLQQYTVKGGQTGSFNLATITFTAKTDSGNTTVSIDRSKSNLGKQNDSTGADVLTSVSGVNIGFAAQPPQEPKNAVAVEEPKELEEANEVAVTQAEDVQEELENQKPESPERKLPIVLLAGLSAIALAGVAFIVYRQFMMSRGPSASGAISTDSHSATDADAKPSAIDSVPQPPAAPGGTVIEPTEADHDDKF